MLIAKIFKATTAKSPGRRSRKESAKIFKGNYREVTQAAKPEGKRQNIQRQLPRSHPGGEAGMLSAKIFKATTAKSAGRRSRNGKRQNIQGNYREVTRAAKPE